MDDDHHPFEAGERTAVSGCHPDEMDRDSPRGETGTCGARRSVLALIPLMLLPMASLVARTYELFPFCCFPLLMLGAALLHRDRPEAAGPADDAEGPGGNGGSPTRDMPPNVPSGGLLLPDAVRAGRRYRGEAASPLIPSRTRRPAHPPERPPVPLRH